MVYCISREKLAGIRLLHGYEAWEAVICKLINENLLSFNIYRFVHYN